MGLTDKPRSSSNPGGALTEHHPSEEVLTDSQGWNCQGGCSGVLRNPGFQHGGVEAPRGVGYGEGVSPPHRGRGIGGGCAAVHPPINYFSIFG